MLDIRTVRTKHKGIRVNIYRKIRNSSVKIDKLGKLSFRMIGSFSLNEGLNNELLKKLQPEEIVELQNWLAEVNFAKRFNVEADNLEKISLHIPSTFKKLLDDLYFKVKSNDRTFIPSYIMLEALFKKIKQEQSLIQRKKVRSKK